MAKQTMQRAQIMHLVKIHTTYKSHDLSINGHAYKLTLNSYHTQDDMTRVVG